MAAIHNDNTFKIALITEDVNGDQTAESFARVCEQAMAALKAHEIGSDFERSYAELTRTPDRFWEKIRSDMHDNYMIGAFVLIKGKLPVHQPLIAWASMNRMEFPGLHEEISLMRALMWAGFDPSAPASPESGITALHAMCNKRYGSGCHPRAVHHLIQGGADVNAQSSNGDTPLITLCGHTGWGEEMSECFKMLYQGGADAEKKSDDGIGAWSLLQKMQREHPHPERQAFIAELAGE